MSTLALATLRNLAGTASTSSDNVINGCAKAWVKFNGSAATIYASFNVSSVTRNSTGNYTANFTNALADANYAPVGGTGSVFGGVSHFTGTTTTTQYQFSTYNSSSSLTDYNPISLSVSR